MPKNGNSIPVEMAKEFAKFSPAATARSITTSITKDTRAASQDNARGEKGYLTMRCTPNTQTRLNKVAETFECAVSDLVRGSIHAALPSMEKVAKEFKVVAAEPEECPECGAHV